MRGVVLINCCFLYWPYTHYTVCRSMIQVGLWFSYEHTYQSWGPAECSSTLIEAAGGQFSFCQEVKDFDWTWRTRNRRCNSVCVSVFASICACRCGNVCRSRSRAVVAIMWLFLDTSRPWIAPAWKQNRHSGSGVCSHRWYKNCDYTGWAHCVNYNNLLHLMI